MELRDIIQGAAVNDNEPHRRPSLLPHLLKSFLIGLIVNGALWYKLHVLTDAVITDFFTNLSE